MPIHKSSLYLTIWVVRNAKEREYFCKICVRKSTRIPKADIRLQMQSQPLFEITGLAEQRYRASLFTFLSLVDDRNQISSLAYAVWPGILPIFVISHNQFVTLFEKEEPNKWRIGRRCVLKEQMDSKIFVNLLLFLGKLPTLVDTLQLGQQSVLLLCWQSRCFFCK